MKTPKLNVGQMVNVEFESGDSLRGKVVRELPGGKYAVSFEGETVEDNFISAIEWASWSGEEGWKEDAHTSVEGTAPVEETKEVLDRYVGKRVSLTCQVGVCIWGEMFTLEPGRGLCEYDCTRDGMRIGIGRHTISKVREQKDGTLAIVIR